MAHPRDRIVREDPTTGLVARSAGRDLDAFRRLLDGHRDFSFRVAFGGEREILATVGKAFLEEFRMMISQGERR
jgi:hypothetical protein